MSVVVDAYERRLLENTHRLPLALQNQVVARVRPQLSLSRVLVRWFSLITSPRRASMTRRRGTRPAPAPEGTWARCVESVACHEADPFPRVLLLLPTLIGVVVGFSFSPLNSSVTGAAGVKETFSAIGFTTAALFICYALAGLPLFRREGCARGCTSIARSAATLPFVAPRRQPDTAPEFELPPHVVNPVNINAA